MKRILLSLTLLAVTSTVISCKQGGVKPDVDVDPDTGTVQDGDGDGDGFTTDEGDCNDTDAATNPGATEVCDGIDNHCDGAIDEGLEQIWYQDADSDGFGDGAILLSTCEAPGGYVENGDDCDDAIGSVYPGALELCTDLIDRDCDGLVGAVDADGDGVAACEDCNDSDPAISPSATEICDAADVDEDCDGLSDDADPSVDPDTQNVIWTDSDGDGYGEDLTVVISCEGTGAAQGGDCNDADVAFYPGAS